MSLGDNGLLTAARTRSLLSAGLVRRSRVDRYARDVIADYAVKCTGPEAEAHSLSGGNMQKFILGREVLQAPRILVASHPTWGVDVGAARRIQQAMIDLSDGGAGVLVVSEDLDELFEICDRIAVICDGRLSPAVPVADADRGQIGEWMTGLGSAPGTAPAGETAAAP
jgi:simple sugar transport system ATP-binding protein